jgi:hypothetical protein
MASTNGDTYAKKSLGPDVGTDPATLDWSVIEPLFVEKGLSAPGRG